jgi:multidrug efflux pump subunit AcrB
MGKEEVRLILNYDLMAKLGITAKDIADTIRIAYDGIVATSIRRDGEEIDFRIKLRNDQRGDVEILDKLLLRNDEGKLIPLGELATFTQRQGIESFNHYNGRRAITITGKVDNLQATSKEVNQMIKDLYVDEIQGISGIKLLFRGEGQATAESMHNFFIAFLCGLLGIYFILLLLLNSYIQPFLIMVAIPFGIVGVLFAFYLHDLPMSFFGLIGTLGMLGVVVNDSLVMVTYLNKLRDKYGRIDTEMILEGAKTRFRPVLLTTITTVIGLFPTLYGIGGYDPFIVPLVLAMSWGLAFATFITLVLVPVLYSFLKPPVS